MNVMEEIIGTRGEIVDFLNENLTQEEWNALCVVHRCTQRLGMGINFEWSKSIDVRLGKRSQIIDESVFMSRDSSG